jgi:hypothetical protein
MLTNNTFELSNLGNRRNEEKPVNDHFRSTRQWLNIIFMIGAIVGVLLYLFHSPQTVGIIVILVSMVFKIIECALRFMK